MTTTVTGHAGGRRGPGDGPLLQVRDLLIRFTRKGRAPVTAVDSVSFDVAAGRSVGIVGESGSGKSVTSLAIMGLLPKRGVHVGGSVTFDGEELLGMSNNRRRSLRGAEMAMVFQDPMSSLNPVVPIGVQVTEVLRRHRDMNKAEARGEAVDLLRRVGIPEAQRRLRDYPHQLSGGMRQRALIAIALACSPRLLVADEPTTALDVTIQAQILDLLRGLVAETGTALVLITHDLGVVAGMCDEVHVMYGGRLVESADRHELFARPEHPYTNGLLASVPRLDSPRGVPLQPIPGSPTLTRPWSTGCAFEPRCTRAQADCLGDPPAMETVRGHGVRCRYPHGAPVGPSGPNAPRSERPRSERHRPARRRGAGMTATDITTEAAGHPQDVLLSVRDVAVHFPIAKGIIRDRVIGHVKAVDGVSIDVRRGSTYGLVGESGCGKSTLGRAVLRLLTPSRGQVWFDGTDIATLRGEQLRRSRSRMQMIFQDPMSSLDPRQSVEAALSEPLRAHGVEAGADGYSGQVAKLLDQVGLPGSAASRFPHEFSGGQRQRIGIARAIALRPELVVADEPVSALDVSVQAQVVNLLEELQDALGLTYVVIAHDLAVVRHVSEVVGVMYLGGIVEEADSDTLYDSPMHPYTLALMSAIPVPDPVIEATRERILLTGDLPSPADPPAGCRFSTRCPFVQPDRCTTERPALREVSPGHRVACHHAEQIKAGRVTRVA